MANNKWTLQEIANTALLSFLKATNYFKARLFLFEQVLSKMTSFKSTKND